jgi:hypothetical protein
MDTEPEQEALFAIMGPDPDGLVWAISTDPTDHWRHNLGPAKKVAHVLSQWLGTVDRGG